MTPEPSSDTPERIRGDGGLGEARDPNVLDAIAALSCQGFPDKARVVMALAARLAEAEKRADEAERERDETATDLHDRFVAAQFDLEVAEMHDMTATAEHWEGAFYAEKKKREAAERQVEALREALSFYANPETYFAIAFMGDSPHGDFLDDFEDVPGFGAEKPGKRARAALAQQGETP